METTYNTLSPYAKNFFNKLSNYLSTKIYFYGSIQRNDYFPDKSDIDVDIFTSNESSTIIQLQNFLGVERRKFKKFIYRGKSELITGYKVSHKEPENNFFTEISIYNEKYKDEIIEIRKKKFSFPFHISAALIIVKFLYYNLCIISKDTFKLVKDAIMDTIEKSQFVVIDIKKDKAKD